MTRIADHRAIVAVDPSSRGVGFVFFERGILLDWGTRTRDGAALAGLDAILARTRADVLVLEDPDAPRCERRPRVRRLLRTMHEHARRRDLTTMLVSRFAVRYAWAKDERTTKHAVAAAIGALFPELEDLVLRRRKVFQTEEARGDIFDAASLALHAFGIEGDGR